MGTAKISFKLGKIDFTGEGEEKWVAAQLDKILEKVSNSLSNSGGTSDGDGDAEATDSPAIDANVGSLASYLQKKSIGKSAVKRFLATAAWLAKKGNKKPKAGEVGKAITDNHQAKLANPADCLNKNVSKGFCEKIGSQFYVTPEGFKSLGE